MTASASCAGRHDSASFNNFLPSPRPRISGTSIKVGQVSMSLRFVNRVRHFLKQLHTNVTQQLFAVVDDPAAPYVRVGAKGLLHP